MIKNEAITLPEKSVPKETKEESRSLWQKFWIFSVFPEKILIS